MISFKQTSSKNLLFGFIVISVLFWSLQSALTRSVLPLDGVESVCWGAKMQWGYYKHPPLSAWIAYAVAWITNYSKLAYYLLPQLSIGIGVWYVYKLAALYFDEYKAALSAMLLYCLHYYTAAPMAFCPNSVQLALQPIMAYYFVRAVKCGKLSDWCVLGVVSGLAMLGKYSAGMLLFAMFAIMLFRKDWRCRIFTPGPWVAALIFAVIFCGHVVWLVKHDYICLTYVQESVNEENSVNHVLNFFYILGTSLYPIAAQMLLLIICTIKDFRRVKSEKEALVYSAAVTWIPIGIILVLAAIEDSIVTMWLSTMASWTGIFSVAIFPFDVTEKTFRRFFTVICIVTVCVFIGTSIDLLCKSKFKEHLDTAKFCMNVEEYWKSRSEEKLACIVGERWFANTMEYFLPYHPESIDYKATPAIDELKARGVQKDVLLVVRHKADMEKCIANLGLNAEVEFTPLQFDYKAIFGKKKQTTVYVQVVRFNALQVKEEASLAEFVGEW